MHPMTYFTLLPHTTHIFSGRYVISFFCSNVLIYLPIYVSIHLPIYRFSFFLSFAFVISKLGRLACCGNYWMKDGWSKRLVVWRIMLGGRIPRRRGNTRPLLRAMLSCKIHTLHRKQELMVSKDKPPQISSHKSEYPVTNTDRS